MVLFLTSLLILPLDNASSTGGQFSGFDFFSAIVDACPFIKSGWSYREMHQLPVRKSVTLELPHVEKIQSFLFRWALWCMPNKSSRWKEMLMFHRIVQPRNANNCFARQNFFHPNDLHSAQPPPVVEHIFVTILWLSFDINGIFYVRTKIMKRNKKKSY